MGLTPRQFQQKFLPSEPAVAIIGDGVQVGSASEVSASISGPLADTLFFRVSGHQKSFDGPVENQYLK